MIHQLQRFGTANLDFAHVAHVEQPHSVAHRVVFVHNAGVLDRHIPPAEIDHLRAPHARWTSFKRSAAQKLIVGHGLGRNQCTVWALLSANGAARSGGTLRRSLIEEAHAIFPLMSR